MNLCWRTVTEKNTQNIEFYGSVGRYFLGTNIQPCGNQHPMKKYVQWKLDIFRNVLKAHSIYKNGTSGQLQSDYLLLFSTNETRSYVPQINIDVKYMCHLVQFNSSTAKEILSNWSNWKVSNSPRAVHPQKFPKVSDSNFKIAEGSSPSRRLHFLAARIHTKSLPGAPASRQRCSKETDLPDIEKNETTTSQKSRKSWVPAGSGRWLLWYP